MSCSILLSKKWLAPGMTFCSIDNSLLGLELLHERGHVLVRHDRIFVSMHDQTGGRTGSQEKEKS